MSATPTGEATLAEICVVACAEAWRGDGEILAGPMGLIPSLGARLARATFAPELMLTDGVASIVDTDGHVEAWMPYRNVFDTVWGGRRHVMMGASQLDRHGNQNISCIGPHERPGTMLIGARGAPGNTINHATSYWIPRHDRRVFVTDVDFVCGVGVDRAAALGISGRFHSLRRVITNLGVFGFRTSGMYVISLHPGVTIDMVSERTGFPVEMGAGEMDAVATTRLPTAEELNLLRTVLDPEGRSAAELPA